MQGSGDMHRYHDIAVYIDAAHRYKPLYFLVLMQNTVLMQSMSLPTGRLAGVFRLNR